MELEENKRLFPIVVGSKITEQSTSFQAQEMLLCSSCEKKLNKDGEKYFFTLYDELNRADKVKSIFKDIAPIMGNLDSQCYNAQNLNINFTTLTYFALSIFWRGAVCNWKLLRQSTKGIQLGPYQEPIREFLMDQKHYPKNVFLTMWISDSPPKGNYFTFPYSTKEDGYHLHKFIVSNIYFVMAVGNKVPNYFQHLCLYSSPLHPILVSNVVYKVMTNNIKTLYHMMN
jgi:hypothetical protein